MNVYTKLKREILPENDAIIFRIEDFGAIGDGVTDDGAAFMAAMEAITNAPADAQKVLYLKSETTYRVMTTKDNGAVIKLDGCDNVMILGDQTKISVKLPCGGISFHHCNHVLLAGIELFFDPSPMFYGTIESFTKDGRTFDFRIDPDERCGFADGENSHTPPYGSAFFMIPDDPDLRQDFFIEKMELLEPGLLRITQNIEMVKNKIQWYMEPVKVGDPYIIPRVGLSHRFPAVIGIGMSDDVTIESSQIHEVPCFCVSLASNGFIKFKDFHLQPDPESKNDLVSWRDGFHCKNQYRLATWEDCSIGMLGDDAYNIATTFFNVIDVIDEKTFTVYPQEGTVIQTIQPGDTIGILDQKEGVMYGEAKITKCVKGAQLNQPATITVDTAIEGLAPGKHMQIIYTAENPVGHIVKNCDIVGSIRVKAPALFEDCNIRTSIFYICNEAWIEGPIPTDITLKNCDIITTMPGQTWINTYPEIPSNEELLAGMPDNNLVIFVDSDGTGPRETRQLKTKNIRIEHCNIKGRMDFNGNDVEVIN